MPFIHHGPGATIFFAVKTIYDIKIDTPNEYVK